MDKKINTQKKKQNQGQAMLITFIYVSISALIGITLMGYAQRINTLVIKEIAHTKAWYAAEAGLMAAISWRFGGNALNQNISFPITSDPLGRLVVVQIEDVDVSPAPPAEQIIFLRATVNNWWQ
ncbi:MAG: hypothetical protein ABIG64_08395 [Candidatus Omnitrophota bacterium]